MKTKNPRKQRKLLYNAPLHKRKKLVSSPLSKELRNQYKRRSMPVRKGDQVEITSGKFRKLKGTVAKVDLKKMRAYVEGATIKKSSGSQANVPISPSNIRIIKPNLDDKFRQRILQRKLGK